MKTKVLVLGCGSIGLRHLRVLLRRGDVEVAAFDVRETACDDVASLGAVAFFSDLSAAASWQPALVVVATPNHLHAEGCLWAFESGAHVLTEKPLTDTVASGEEVVAAAERAGKILAVGYTERYRPAFDHMRQQIAAGQLGELVGGRAMVGTYNTLLCAKDPAHRCGAFGSLLVDYTHELDWLFAFFGRHQRLECFANHLGNKALQANPGLAALLIEYQSGAVVTVHMDYVQHPQRRIFELYGDQGSFVYDFGSDQLTVYDSEAEDARTVTFQNDRDEQFEREHEDILSAMRTGALPRVNGSDGLESLRVAEAAIAKIREASEL